MVWQKKHVLIASTLERFKELKIVFYFVHKSNYVSCQKLKN